MLILAGAVLLSWQGTAEGVGWGALAIIGALLDLGNGQQPHPQVQRR
jgi:hypothetical protein